MDKNKISIDSFIKLAETPEPHAPHCTRVYLTVDQQRFTIAICELPEEAEWWKSQLAKALTKIVDRHIHEV